ncbi:hypothetical protein, partial [Arthrobacter sp. GN70]|uniref:hypothetical protein n=1 Tax=Arthrobacter sp. GN70 TaxID=2838876 RepID=UPI001BFDD07F
NQPKNQTTTHGGAQQPSKSTNQKTIGINKLGTLLSSQTTDTPDTTQQPSGSLRSNFPNLPEPRNQSKSATHPAPTQQQHATKARHNQAI